MIIPIKLGFAFYNQGFIYIKVKYADYFGKQGELIDVYLGKWESKPFSGWINRNAQATDSPRIMMGTEYTNWVQSNYKLGDTIEICLDQIDKGKILIR